MKQKIKDKSFTDILKDTQHNEKAKEVFLKLYAKRRGKYTGWNAVKGETLASDKFEIK
jgi:hypothetical protein